MREGVLIVERKLFTAFRETVMNANQNSDVWYAGYLWLALNRRQAEEIIKLLKVHPSIIREGDRLILPSGISLKA